MSAGHAAIAKLVHRHGVVWVERKLGVTDGTVRKWLKLGCTPQKRIRERVAEVFQIDVKTWELATSFVHHGPKFFEELSSKSAVQRAADRKTGAPAPNIPVGVADVEKDKAGAERPVGDRVEDNLRHIIARLRRELDKAEGPEVSRLTNAISNACRALKQGSDEREVTEGQILRAPAFVRVMTAIGEVLAKFPGAAGELEKAMARYAENG